MPILNNVLIKAEKDSIFLTTSNLDIGIRCQIKAEVASPGGLTLPVRKLATIIKALPNNDVEIEMTEGFQAKIASGGSLFKIMGLTETEFPKLSAFDDKHVFDLDQVQLLNMIKSVSYAQSSDENRSILNGVYFIFEEDKFSLVATDGRRLAVTGNTMPVSQENAGSLILPAKTVTELERLLGQGKSLKIAFNDRQVAFEIEIEDSSGENGLKESIYLVSKIVEGKYPNYKQVIPQQTEFRIKVERELMLDCVQRAALVTTDKSSSVRMRVSENLLEISGASAEYGESHESMAIAFEGSSVEVAFNPFFLMDPLKALTHDEVYFEFKDEMSPGVFKTLDSFLCVIMPLRN